MEPSKEPIAVRITRLNRQILGKVTSGSKFIKKNIDREALLDALTVLYDECNEDPVKKSDDLVRAFVDRYRSTLAELRRARVCFSDFEVLQTIGRGYFGEVYMVREKQTADVYALKSVRKEVARKRAAGAAEDERDVLANANTAWVPKLQYAFQDTNSLYLVMELCSGGDLAGLLSRRHHPLSEQDAAFYVAEVAHALKAIHAMGYVHRDVKPDNILLDRCGHVKLGDFGSCARLSGEQAGAAEGGTADYVAPELLAAVDCAERHAVCSHLCRGIVTTALSACDYWSLGVVAFELVTLKRPFSNSDEDSISQILANIQKYERSSSPSPPFSPAPAGPSDVWRALTAGLLRVTPARRYNYLDTLQHPALAHLPTHSIRDQPPPWVPVLRGAEDASCHTPAPRPPPAPSAAPFRARPPFAGQLPFIGYSYVVPEESEEQHSSGFSSSHDCTAIDMATFKSAEKLSALRGRELASLQSKLTALEGACGAAGERARRAEADAERQRARAHADVTALTLQNKRLERQVEVEKEERMALERTIQELQSGIVERNNAEVAAARAEALEAALERESLREQTERLQARANELQADCSRAQAAAEQARAQQRHYKDTIAKERALRRQTLTGGEVENKEAGAKAAAAEAQAAKETRARELAEKKLQQSEADNYKLRADIDDLRRELTSIQESFGENQRVALSSKDQLTEVQLQLTQERVRSSTLLAQLQELERSVEEAHRREAAVEEQCQRTEARLHERLDAAEARAASALQDDARYREKVSTLEQLVRQLEREVGALEKRVCVSCEERDKHAHSDTESVDGTHTHTQLQAQLAAAREQLERAEAQLQARAEEIAALKQETRTANLARWRKERELNELQVETKSTSRDLKRAEERLTAALEAKKTAEKKASELQSEINVLKPQHERVSREAERSKEKLDSIQRSHDKLEAEVDRSRNDIRKLKSELQYSEKRRVHAEEQEELSSRERASLRDELTQVNHQYQLTLANNRGLQEACGLLEEQLNDLEKLADLNEIKNKDLENETERLRSELSTCRSKLMDTERSAGERSASAHLLTQQYDVALQQARDATSQLQALTERLENRESKVVELESVVSRLEGELCGKQLSLTSAARRLRELQEECSELQTRLHHHRASALQLQEQLTHANEQLSEARETSEAAGAWWRARETKADATIRQQAKLIDFLQAKLEEAGRKKGSLSNKLFGRSGRRPNASPPLVRANRELREEIDRLRARLASHNSADNYPPTTPRREKSKPVPRNIESIDTPDGKGQEDNSKVQIVWSDGSRERMRARLSDDAVVLTTDAGHEMKAKLVPGHVPNVPANEANRAVAIRVDKSSKGSEAALVCGDVRSLGAWQAPAACWAPARLADTRSAPLAALYLDTHAVAIGCEDGLHSLRGIIELEHELPERDVGWRVSQVTCSGSRALVLWGAVTYHASRHTLLSALRRANTLRPALQLKPIVLPDNKPHLIKAMAGESNNGICVAVACGRRVFLLKWEAASTEYRVCRSLTVDRAPDSLLLTPAALYITGEKPLKVNLPSGVLEAFGNDDTVSAAARRKSPPRAIFLVKEKPAEILICYSECGIFLDDTGRRTRNEDPKWSATVTSWEFVYPFLYICSSDEITIMYISDEAYRSPPCTCDSEPPSSAASTASDYVPPAFHYKAPELAILGPAPSGVIIRSRRDDKYEVSYLEGLAAFRSVGASVESLETVSDSRGSSVDLADVTAYEANAKDDSLHETSAESVAVTGFLADIRNRAKQIKTKTKTDQTRDDVIKQILTTEVGLKRQSNGRNSPATTSEFDSDSDSEDNTESHNTADLCAEMFTRQVRFH